MSRFLRVRCDCETDAIVFGSTTTPAACATCGRVLARPTGGKALIDARILEVL